MAKDTSSTLRVLDLSYWWTWPYDVQLPPSVAVRRRLRRLTHAGHSRRSAGSTGDGRQFMLSL